MRETHFSTYSFYFPILAPDIRPPPPTLLTGMLEPPPPPPGVEPDQDDIGIKFKSFDLNKVEHEPPRTLAGYEAEVNVWPIFNLHENCFTYDFLLQFKHRPDYLDPGFGDPGKWKVVFFQRKDPLKKNNV